MLVPLLTSILVIFVLSRFVKVSKDRQSVDNLPGILTPFFPLGLPGALLRSKGRWLAGIDVHWVRRFDLYKLGENISIISYLIGPPVIYSSSIEVARQVVVGGHKTPFLKPESASQALLLWGMNLVAADGEMWRKHRRVMGPAFNAKLYQMVWSETLQLYREMVSAEGWTGKDAVQVPVMQTLTFKLALLIIGKCGFGFSFNWSDPPTTPDGKMSVQNALRISADTHMFQVAAPKWVHYLPIKAIREADDAHERLKEFMQAQVEERKNHISDDAVDVFSLLVKANANEGKYGLDDQELIGNVFIMLFAGHETTAHTLAATLGLLAIHQDIQDEVYKEIIDVVGHDRDPELEDYQKLVKVLSVFYEALRMFPAGHVMIREATEDTTIEICEHQDSTTTRRLPVPKGQQVVIDMIGVQYNPRYFPDPATFKPSRWYSVIESAGPDTEIFSAFSVGPRACLGRRFATTEAVALLAAFLRDWKVLPKRTDGVKDVGKGDHELDAVVVIALGVEDVPVELVRR